MSAPASLRSCPQERRLTPNAMLTTHFHRRQRGTTLLEALVAFLVLSLGMLTVARVQTQLRANSDVARQRSEAVRLGQDDLETLRAFSVLAATAGARAYADVTSGTRVVDSAAGYASNTRYLVTRQIDASNAPRTKSANVSVSWTDRAGDTQRVVLNSVISGTDPAYSGALGMPRSATQAKGPFGRALSIPLASKDLGNGSSAFKPVRGGSVALVFDNTTGQVSARCTGVAPGTPTAALSSADLGTCDARPGQLLSGVVRFTQASPPQPGAANEVPAAVAVALSLTGGTYPQAPVCDAEPVKTVTYTAAGGLRVEVVPINATPASIGVASWSDTGDRHTAYSCVVYPLASGAWSGRATLVPTGWTVGSGPADRRVCRYTADLDGNGAIDANTEHPVDYAGVTGALAQQNYLVVNGSDTCPAAAATRITGQAGDVFANLGTAAHQP